MLQIDSEFERVSHGRNYERYAGMGEWMELIAEADMTWDQAMNQPQSPTSTPSDMLPEMKLYFLKILLQMKLYF